MVGLTGLGDEIGVGARAGEADPFRFRLGSSATPFNSLRRFFPLGSDSRSRSDWTEDWDTFLASEVLEVLALSLVGGGGDGDLVIRAFLGCAGNCAVVEDGLLVDPALAAALASFLIVSLPLMTPPLGFAPAPPAATVTTTPGGEPTDESEVLAVPLDVWDSLPPLDDEPSDDDEPLRVGETALAPPPAEVDATAGSSSSGGDPAWGEPTSPSLVLRLRLMLGGSVPLPSRKLVVGLGGTADSRDGARGLLPLRLSAPAEGTGEPVRPGAKAVAGLSRTWVRRSARSCAVCW